MIDILLDKNDQKRIVGGIGTNPSEPPDGSTTGQDPLQLDQTDPNPSQPPDGN